MNNRDDNQHQKKPVAIILAAGKGARFGGGKLMAKLPSGKRVIDRVVAKTIQEFDEYCCIVRKEDVELQQHLDRQQWRWVIADHADEGMSQSLICGIGVFPKATGWVFVLADMPYVLSSTLARLGETLRHNNDQPRIVIPRHQEKTGNPVGLSAHFKCELEKLKGDVGARSIVAQNQNSAVWIDVEDTGIFHDIDRPSDIKLSQ
ncbi:MAG: nucleotidyltransferase family protein [Cellvibrionaceae bacterium]